jgi:hypothetical protein
MKFSTLVKIRHEDLQNRLFLQTAGRGNKKLLRGISHLYEE